MQRRSGSCDIAGIASVQQMLPVTLGFRPAVLAQFCAKPKIMPKHDGHAHCREPRIAMGRIASHRSMTE